MRKLPSTSWPGSALGTGRTWDRSLRSGHRLVGHWHRVGRAGYRARLGVRVAVSCHRLTSRDYLSRRIIADHFLID
jgi:hypothetical protein